MSELIVIGYKTAEQAEKVRQQFLDLQSEYIVDLSDAVVATADKKGHIKLSQLVHPWAIGATGGSFWGVLIGLLFLHPLLGLAVGATAGLISGALSDYGLNDVFMKKVAKVLQPGQAALFIFARQLSGDRIIAALAPSGGEVIRTNLSSTDEEKLRAVLKRVHAETPSQAPAEKKSA
ncbi:MAG: DUF1269 domain-containing protein [Hyphomonadaceae bacterium]|nr:DUF1269 domain-containing protein [Hyphomonadaceae bacterium]